MACSGSNVNAYAEFGGSLIRCFFANDTLFYIYVWQTLCTFEKYNAAKLVWHRGPTFTRYTRQQQQCGL